MLDYLYNSALQYQQLHGLKPNLVYLNNAHMQTLQKQLENQDQLALLFSALDLKVALSPSLPHTPALLAYNSVTPPVAVIHSTQGCTILEKRLFESIRIGALAREIRLETEKNNAWLVCAKLLR